MGGHELVYAALKKKSNQFSKKNKKEFVQHDGFPKQIMTIDDEKEWG